MYIIIKIPAEYFFFKLCSDSQLIIGIIRNTELSGIFFQAFLAERVCFSADVDIYIRMIL